MSIYHLDVISHETNVPIEIVLGDITEGANRHRCTADQLSEAVYMAVLWGATLEDAIKESVEYFDCGMNMDMVAINLHEKYKNIKS